MLEAAEIDLSDLAIPLDRTVTAAASNDGMQRCAIVVSPNACPVFARATQEVPVSVLCLMFSLPLPLPFPLPLPLP